jgi:hypothetical protein
VVKQMTGMRIAAVRQWDVAMGLMDVQPMRMQLRTERQIPTAAKPTTNSVAETRKPLRCQFLAHCAGELT